MAVRSNHTFVSGVADGADATLVRPSNWNADIGLKLVGPGLVGKPTAADGAAVEVTLVANLRFVGATLDLNTSIELPALAASPTNPAAGNGTRFIRNIAERMHGVIESPNGYDYTYQPHLFRNPTAWWQANGNAVTISLNAATAFTAVGTVTSANTATTNRYTRIRKVESLVTTAATTAVAGWYHTTSRHWTIGNGTADGGFFFIMRGGPATGVATFTGHRFAMGLTNVITVPTDVNPSTVANSILLGYDAADTQWQIISHNGTAATKVALGASFPKPTADRASMLELTLYCAPSQATVGWTVQDMISGATVSGTIAAANLPSNTTLLAPRIWHSTNAVSSVSGVVFCICSIETEY